MNPRLKEILKRRGWKIGGYSNTGKIVKNFENKKISKKLFEIILSDQIYRMLMMVLFKNIEKKENVINLDKIVDEIMKRNKNLRYTLKEAPIKRYVCKYCKKEIPLPIHEISNTKISMCPNCGKKELQCEDWWECDNKFLFRSLIAHYVGFLEKEGMVDRNLEISCPFCQHIPKHIPEENLRSIRQLKCEKCGRIMEINYVFTPHKEIMELWRDGYWLEWYVKNLLNSSLETDIYSGIKMKKIKNEREIEVDCILYFSNKVISIQCKAKDFSKSYKEDPKILDLMEFSDVIIFVTTTEISESLKSKWKRIKPKIKKKFVRGWEIEDLPNIIKRCIK